MQIQTSKPILTPFPQGKVEICQANFEEGYCSQLYTISRCFSRKEKTRRCFTLDHILCGGGAYLIAGNCANAAWPFANVIDREPDGKRLAIGGREIELIVALVHRTRHKLRLGALDIGSFGDRHRVLLENGIDRLLERFH